MPDTLPRATSSFPTEILGRCQSALLLYCAGFYGRNDGIHVLEAGIEDVLGVDTDVEKIAVMRGLYPDSWEFLVGDATTVATHLWAEGRKFDLVVCDCPLGLAEQVQEQVVLWCDLANEAVVLTVGSETQRAPAPAGWEISTLERNSAGTAWEVLCPS